MSKLQPIHTDRPVFMVDFSEVAKTASGSKSIFVTSLKTPYLIQGHGNFGA